MSEIYITGKYKEEAARMGFMYEHHVSPEIAQIARGIAEQNLQIMSHLMADGTLTEEKYLAILNNSAVQYTFASMARHLEEGDEKLFETEFNRVIADPDLLCGWCDFYNEHLENTLNIELIKRPRKKTHYEEYLARKIFRG